MLCLEVTMFAPTFIFVYNRQCCVSTACMAGRNAFFMAASVFQNVKPRGCYTQLSYPQYDALIGSLTFVSLHCPCTICMLFHFLSSQYHSIQL